MSAVSASEHAKALRRIEELEALLKKQEHISNKVDKQMEELNKRMFDEQENYYMNKLNKKTEKIATLKSKIESIEDENRELHYVLSLKNLTLEEYKNDIEELNRDYRNLNQEYNKVSHENIKLDSNITSYQINVLSLEDKIYKLNNKNTKNNLIKQNLPLSIPNDVLNIINDYSDDKYTNIYKSVVKDIPFAADRFLSMKYEYITPFWNETTVFQFREVRSQISKDVQAFRRYQYNFPKHEIFDV